MTYYFGSVLEKGEDADENTKTWFMLLEFYYFNLG